MRRRRGGKGACTGHAHTPHANVRNKVRHALLKYVLMYAMPQMDGTCGREGGHVIVIGTKPRIPFAPRKKNGTEETGECSRAGASSLATKNSSADTPNSSLLCCTHFKKRFVSCHSFSFNTAHPQADGHDVISYIITHPNPHTLSADHSDGVNT